MYHWNVRRMSKDVGILKLRMRSVLRLHKQMNNKKVKICIGTVSIFIGTTQRTTLYKITTIALNPIRVNYENY
jgi:hypothetical protein